jgi:hypothetical protein
LAREPPPQGLEAALPRRNEIELVCGAAILFEYFDDLLKIYGELAYA